MNALKIISEADWKLEHNEITLGEYMDMVEPLSEVVPVRHGHWIHDRCGYRHDYYICSCCGTSIPDAQDDPYCKVCGCRMDEVAE